MPELALAALAALIAANSEQVRVRGWFTDGHRTDTLRRYRDYRP